MSKNHFSREEFKVRVLKLKNRLYSEHYSYSSDPKGLAHKYLNEILDMIDEYRY